MKLKNRNLFKTQALLKGWESAKNNATFGVFNPADNSCLGEVPDMGKVETMEAIGNAKDSFAFWKNFSAKSRAKILLNWYENVLRNKEDLAKIMVAEQGKPYKEAEAETVYGANFIEWFAEQGKRIRGEVMSDFEENKTLQYTKEAIGVVGIITPWNFPLAMITRKVAPALAAGCSVVVKPSDLTPFSALALGELALESGLPDGVFQIITGKNAKDIGETLCSSKAVKKISFTGSTEVGKKLFSQSASTIKKLSLELGGNAAFIVFDDADLTSSLESLILCKFRNSGQTCVCANRIFVQKKIYNDFLKKLKEKVEKLKVGNGMLPNIEQGPLIQESAVKKVEKHIKLALESGAKIIVGGKRHSLGGTFFEPTILVEVPENSIFWQEETFGPVAPITIFESEEEVIKMVNNTDYGLANYFCTKDFSRIQRFNKKLESGIIGVNTGIISNEFAPFGGIKESGIGREGAEIGIEEFLQIKYSLISYK